MKITIEMLPGANIATVKRPFRRKRFYVNSPRAPLLWLCEKEPEGHASFQLGKRLAAALALASARSAVSIPQIAGPNVVWSPEDQPEP